MSHPFNIKKSQISSTKYQINYNTCTEHSRSNQNGLGHLLIDIWILFVFCFLLFGALFTRMFYFIDNTK